jgi:YVTN family beta-propeller protein
MSRYASGIVFAVLLGAVGFALPARTADFSTLVDIDNDDASGCTVGTFLGADFELVTSVDTAVDPPVVTGLALNQCAGGTLIPHGGPNPFTQFSPPWPAGSVSGLDAVETYLPLSVGTVGTAIQLGFFSGPRSAPADVLFTTDGQPAGDPIVLQGVAVAVPTLGGWGLLALGGLLCAAGCVTLQRRRSRAGILAGLLLLSSGLGAAVAASPHIPDGNLTDWAGHNAVGNDVFPPPDAPVNFEIRRAFATLEGGTLFLRIDVDASVVPPPVDRFAGPTSSQPLALSANGDFLAVANPDNDSVSFFDVRGDLNLRVATVPVQSEPNGVVFMPDGRRAYAANTVSGTVSVLDVDLANGVAGTPTTHIPVGTEPYALALTPNGTKLYVADSRSDSISVVDTATNTVVDTVFNAGREPRGLAVTNDGDADDADEKLYVTSFLTEPIAGAPEGADNARQGEVTVVSTATDVVVGTVSINPLADTGFRAAGDALGRIPPGPSFTFTTGAFPNQLNNVAVHGGFAYLPNTGASPNGPVRFDVNTQSLLVAINTTTDVDAGVTLNMHTAVAGQTGLPKLFITQPWAMAFKHGADQGYVVSAASNIVVKVAVNPATGAPVVLSDPTDATRVLQIPVGRNPRGIVVNWNDTRAYVMNYISRDVSVIDLTGVREQVIATLPSASLPTPGTPEDLVQIGKELYNTSVGVFDPATPGGQPITGRMSASGWGACATCHPSGLSDQVVWIFPDGPRRTIPQHADFDPGDPLRQQMRILNASASRDEQEDFENNIRLVSGGAGLIVLPDGVTPDPDVNNFTPLANAGRNQLKVRGVGAWDALKAYVRFGIRAPLSPVPPNDPDVIAGRALFISANCQQCHGGNHWSQSRVRYTPPPAPAQVVNGQILAELRNVGTFDPTAFNEVRQDASPPLGASGYAPPTLLSAFAFERPQLHNGAAQSFDEVLNNVTHRSAGTGGVDTLSNPADRARIARFLRSIDASTTPIPIP